MKKGYRSAEGVNEVSSILTVIAAEREDVSSMERRGEYKQSAGEFDLLDTVLPKKGDRKITQKALEYTVENKDKKAHNSEKKLWLVVCARSS